MAQFLTPVIGSTLVPPSIFAMTIRLAPNPNIHVTGLIALSFLML